MRLIQLISILTLVSSVEYLLHFKTPISWNETTFTFDSFISIHARGRMQRMFQKQLDSIDVVVDQNIVENMFSDQYSSVSVPQVLIFVGNIEFLILSLVIVKIWQKKWKDYANLILVLHKGAIVDTFGGYLELQGISVIVLDSICSSTIEIFANDGCLKKLSVANSIFMIWAGHHQSYELTLQAHSKHIRTIVLHGSYDLLLREYYYHHVNDKDGIKNYKLFHKYMKGDSKTYPKLSAMIKIAFLNVFSSYESHQFIANTPTLLSLDSTVSIGSLAHEYISGSDIPSRNRRGKSPIYSEASHSRNFGTSEDSSDSSLSSGSIIIIFPTSAPLLLFQLFRLTTLIQAFSSSFPDMRILVYSLHHFNFLTKHFTSDFNITASNYILPTNVFPIPPASWTPSHLVQRVACASLLIAVDAEMLTFALATRTPTLAILLHQRAYLHFHTALHGNNLSQDGLKQLDAEEGRLHGQSKRHSSSLNSDPKRLHISNLDYLSAAESPEPAQSRRRLIQDGEWVKLARAMMTASSVPNCPSPSDITDLNATDGEHTEVPRTATACCDLGQRAPAPAILSTMSDGSASDRLWCALCREGVLRNGCKYVRRGMDHVGVGPGEEYSGEEDGGRGNGLTGCENDFYYQNDWRPVMTNADMKTEAEGEKVSSVDSGRNGREAGLSDGGNAGRDTSSPSSPTVTVILTQFKRNTSFEQIYALHKQTYAPHIRQIFIYQDMCHESLAYLKNLTADAIYLERPREERVEAGEVAARRNRGDLSERARARRLIPIHVVHSTSKNFKYHGRFALSLLVSRDSDYVWVLDDDTFPQSGWLERAVRTSRSLHAVVGPTGVILGRDRQYIVAPPTDFDAEVSANVSPVPV